MRQTIFTQPKDQSAQESYERMPLYPCCLTFPLRNKMVTEASPLAGQNIRQKEPLKRIIELMDEEETQIKESFIIVPTMIFVQSFRYLGNHTSEKSSAGTLPSQPFPLYNVVQSHSAKYVANIFVNDNATDRSPFQDYPQSDNQTSRAYLKPTVS